ncbi:hypothetical protein MVLG_02457 [Microbotryum lychnidis-dioicae p1A1 Lamole]|uniref:Major facilitator superfamily (MFS) profile domain-containing protein n=1 Tax=Microbotryum lychnidis-dioicae (strain p1A1 Lamole / MvSl-1064) TaxID=683840 RepID=U5H580_USTV1|nr:hypothetical protein MVLG_02457 [Microbotryum lychnidis-dioicae p1A1 Lamole]|eukprot:KDE07235.1 hypothetical protein MVLG_02457 [Microbotryum lychnidis-dioicae p1A1 Lamole]
MATPHASVSAQQDLGRQPQSTQWASESSTSHTTLAPDMKHEDHVDFSTKSELGSDGLPKLQDTDVEKGGAAVTNSPPPTVPMAPALAADDPENPRTWAKGKKIYVNFVLCIWVLSLTYASTAYVASIRVIEARFRITQEVAILGVTLMVLGFAAGPLLFGPLSEVYGRRPVYVVTGLCYSAFSFGAAFADSTASLLAFRFFMGFFGSSSINNVPASIGDFTTPLERGPYTILYALSAFGGPSLGPLCSPYIEARIGWRWNFRVMAIFSTVMSILVALAPETHGPTILKAKIKREGNAPPALTFIQAINVYKVAIKRPLLYLFTEPIVTVVSLYLAILYGILYGFFNGFIVVWMETRHFSSTSYGLTYISLGCGFLFGCVMLATVGVKVYNKAAAKAEAEGVPTPAESRLVLAYFGAPAVPLALFLFAGTAPFPHIHWVVPCIAEFLFSAGMLMVFTAFIPYLFETYMATSASALAAGMASRATVGAVFPLFSVQAFHGLGITGASCLLGGVSVLLAPIPFIFRVYGPRIRAKSKYAVHVQ